MSPEQICNITLNYARNNTAIISGAMTGSYARQEADSYSDIDLFFAHRAEYSHEQVIEDFTQEIKQRCGLWHYFDISTDTSLYRAFLLPDWQELDIGVCAEKDFCQIGNEPLKIIFGQISLSEANAMENDISPPTLDRIWVGYAWHHALHVRTAIARSRTWTALYWLNSLRDLIISRFSVLHQLPGHYAKGADRLPAEIQEKLRLTIPNSGEFTELSRAFTNLIPLFVQLIQDEDGLMELAAALPDLIQ